LHFAAPKKFYEGCPYVTLSSAYSEGIRKIAFKVIFIIGKLATLFSKYNFVLEDDYES
jgi:hypothetical protein